MNVNINAFLILIIFCLTGIAVSLNDHEVKVFSKKGPMYLEQDSLNEHGQRVTGIDWAAKSNRIVTCGAVSIISLSRATIYM